MPKNLCFLSLPPPFPSQAYSTCRWLKSSRNYILFLPALYSDIVSKNKNRQHPPASSKHLPTQPLPPPALSDSQVVRVYMYTVQQTEQGEVLLLINILCAVHIYNTDYSILYSFFQPQSQINKFSRSRQAHLYVLSGNLPLSSHLPSQTVNNLFYCQHICQVSKSTQWLVIKSSFVQLIPINAVVRSRWSQN